MQNGLQFAFYKLVFHPQNIGSGIRIPVVDQKIISMNSSKCQSC
jgi:hypothetical protein